MTLISSANNTVSDTEFIRRGMSFIYTMNTREPRIDPWGTPCFEVPPERKKIFSSVRWFYFNSLSLLLVKQDLKQSSDSPQIP